MHKLYQQLRIIGNASTAYHPQTDSQMERINQEVEHYLQVFTNHHQNDWTEWLVLAKFSYNDQVQASTNFSPFFLNYGCHPWKGSDHHREA